jgi:hypothetical protein
MLLRYQGPLMASASLHRLARLSWADRLLLAEALLVLACASLAIRLLSFRRVVRGASRIHAARRDPAGESVTIRKTVWAVRAVSRRVPWRTVCFQCGLAVHFMLRRRGIESHLHYGVAKDSDAGLKAHVWVSAAGRDAIGGEEAAGFACLATYPPVAA